MQLISRFPVYYHDDLQDYHGYKILQSFRNGIEQQANCLSLIVRVKPISFMKILNIMMMINMSLL